MNPFVIGAAVGMVLQLLRAWMETVTFVRWATIEEALGPALHKAGCKDLRLQAAGSMVRLSLQKRVLGAWLPVELLILPIGLDLGKEIRLGLSLQGARLRRPSGFRALFAFWMAKVGLLFKRTTIERLIADAIAQHGEVQGDIAWFCLDEMPPFKTFTEIRRNLPMDIPLSPVATCDGIYPKEDGVQFDISAGPAVRFAEFLVNNRLLREAS